MNIMLFGVSCVGKTTIGKIIADKLGYDFYDLDNEIEKYCHMTIEQFVKTGWFYERDKTRGIVIGNTLNIPGDKVFAIAPIYYSRNFNKYLEREDVIAIELQDTVENIFDRLAFYDENGNLYDDSEEYKEKHRDHYLKEVKEDIAAYKKSFKKIQNKYFINNDPPEKVADDLIQRYKLYHKRIMIQKEK